MSGPIKTFQSWWEALSQTAKERMNLHDAEFVWMACSVNINAARLQGRREALRDLFWELESHDYFSEARLVSSFYKTDKSAEHGGESYFSNWGK